MKETMIDLVKSFDGISLSEMENVKLMDRRDTKYTFCKELLASVLEQAMPHYRCLEIEGKRNMLYQTLYYDTQNLSLYLKHHNGGLNRYKIRHRTYVESSLSFVEIKFKNNKGRTIKTRVKDNTDPGSFSTKALDFLQKGLPFTPVSLVPVVWVNYRRMTLVSKYGAERVTIDTGLEFVKGDKQKTLQELAIVEVKQDKKNPSPFLQLMKEKHIREGSMSKYCFAITTMYGDVKKNNFKQKLLSLKHILNYDFAAGIN